MTKFTTIGNAKYIDANAVIKLRDNIEVLKRHSVSALNSAGRRHTDEIDKQYELGRLMALSFIAEEIDTLLQQTGELDE